MRFAIPFVFIFLLLYGCVTRKKEMHDGENQLVKFSGTINAENLSEDGTVLSTKNDEIVFLNYYVPDDTTRSPITLDENYYEFDSLRRVEHFYATLNGPYTNGNICMLVIEIDGERTQHYYDSLCTGKLLQIKNAVAANNQQYLEKIFGDDDLLGIKEVEMKRIPDNGSAILTFEGHQLFEKYKYTVDIKRLP
jgi:hypothetical protein